MARDLSARGSRAAVAQAAAIAALAVLAALAAAACGGGGQPAPTPSGISTGVPTVGDGRGAIATTLPTAAPATPLAVETVVVDTAGPSPDDEFALDGALLRVLVAMKSHNAAGLRELAGTQLHERLQDADYAALASCVPAGTDVQIEDRSSDISGDAATITAHFAVTANGSTATVQRVWLFERQADGSWKLADVPGCP